MIAKEVSVLTSAKKTEATRECDLPEALPEFVDALETLEGVAVDTECKTSHDDDKERQETSLHKDKGKLLKH